MKKIINISLLFFLAGVISCTDFAMKENPVGVLSPEGFFKTENDVEAAIMGAHGLMSTEAYFGRKLTLTLLLLGDMCDIGNRGTPARRQQVNDFEMDASNGMVTAFWPSSYEIISAANSALNGAQLIEASEEKKNALMAEAMFIRSFVYYHLVRLFEDIPYVDEFITDPVSVGEMSKTPAEQVYEAIINDLEFAILHLPITHPNNARNRASQGSARTMLASVHLTLGNYDEAYAHAKWVIDNRIELGYGLMDDYQSVFDANQSVGMQESIFVVDFIGQTNGFDDLLGVLTGVLESDMQGWSVSVPSLAVYNSFEDSDYRKSVAFIDETLVNGVPTPYTDFVNTPRPHVAKYNRFPGNSDANNRRTDNNYFGFRYAEVLLIAAEALGEVNNGPNVEAIGYINEIRARARNWAGTVSAYPQDAEVTDYNGYQDFIDGIIEERRIELSFEFKRWYDIKRRNMGVQVFTAPNSLEPHANFDPNIHYFLPLPADELDKNPNLLPQNPGY